MILHWGISFPTTGIHLTFFTYQNNYLKIVFESDAFLLQKNIGIITLKHLLSQRTTISSTVLMIANQLKVSRVSL